MKTEYCIVVDSSDKVRFQATKQACHFKHGLLHRAFSLFIFRQSPHCAELELLIQQRSPVKLTYPSLWSNTCCSHPCTNYTKETIEHDAIGVRHAAQRKVKHELGIDFTSKLPLKDIHFLTRIKYSAHNEPIENDWCEQEIDYILVSIIPNSIQTDLLTFLNINAQEVAKVKWAKAQMINRSFVHNPYRYTPWFRKLMQIGLLDKLFNWASAKATHSQAFHSLDKAFDRNNILELN